ncbi:MAG: S8 family serine peptidase, partial [Pseudonocardiales bacterium]
IAVIDTGIDYTHANFGGPGKTAAAYAAAKATDDVANPAFPTAKVIGGYDFAGDAYQADPNSANYDPVPHPDPNPLDCGGHGSHVSGTAAGLGETANGTTFAGPYNTSTPFDTMRIGPGMAPQAKLLAYKVFGCEGSTDVVGAAIDRAGDPNGDGDPTDHANVINMSLGSDYGSPQDGDSVASNDASSLGISVVVASGNGGDYYDIGGSPGDATKTIAVANSVDAYNQIDTLHVSTPAAASYGAERSVAYDWATKPDLAGVVAQKLSPGNEDGCDALSATDISKVTGKIAFLEWTDDDTVRRCGSVTRSGNVVAAGAIGFIFADDSETFAAGITGSAVKPGVLVIKSAGDAIRAQLAANQTVTVSGTSAGDYRQIVNGDNDKVNASSSRGIRGAGNVKPDVTAVGTSVFSTAMGTGTEGVAFTGTSMATPMVAGLSALVTSLHPDWTAEEVKADIMNTAGQDLFTGGTPNGNGIGDRYAPNRVGAGRIQADKALDNTVLAMVTDDPGAVSVSFGPVAVTGAMTITKTIKVVNKGLTPVTYNVAYDPITEVPGVTYTVSSPTIAVDGRSTKTFTVSFVVTDASKLTKTIDPTVARNQAGLPREYVADASGRVLLTSNGKPELRVPVYSAPRPASVMTQPASVTLPTGNVIQQALLPLSGHSVNQGTGLEAVQSTVSGFELQAVSGLAPTCAGAVTSGCVHFSDERSADLKYVGYTSNAPQLSSIGGNVSTDGMLYFSVTTQGPWRSAASTQEFDILLDINRDGTPDAVMFNTRLAGQDTMVSETIDLTTGDVLDIEAINDRLGDVDTALFDSDTMVLPVAIGALPGLAPSTRLNYGVESFSNDAAAPVDAVGVNAAGNPNGSLSLVAYRPGVAVFGSFDGSASPLLFQDQPGSVLSVRRDASAYGADHGLGGLIVHFHNKVGAKAQRVNLKVAPKVTLKLSPTTATTKTVVTATISVQNQTGVPASGIVGLRHIGGSIYASGALKNGVVVFKFVQTVRGTLQFRAEFAGDNEYLAGNSNVVVLTVR